MPPPININPLLSPQQLLQQTSNMMGNVPFKAAPYNNLIKGGLLNFQYIFWKHDPVPLILITDVFVDKIRGVNLHYLSFSYIRRILQQYCGKMALSYTHIKGDAYLVNAFRTYKRTGIKNMQVLDCNTINTQLMGRKSYNPQEMKAIRENIKEQLRRSVNPNAEQMAKEYINILGQGQQVAMPNTFGNSQAQNQPSQTQGTIPGNQATIPGQSASF